MSSEMDRLADEMRILIVRLSAVGDCVQTMPLAAAIKDRFPRAWIAWAVEPASAPLVEAVQAVDQVIIVPKRVCRSPAGLWRRNTPLYDRISLRASRWLAQHAAGTLSRLVRYRLGRVLVLGQTHGRPTQR